jgi:TetR/AcrR family fatty acid metabolism transcriptional regulator
MTHDTSDPIQEQLIRARRSQILDAATTVFAEKGFERATIRDVAKHAGIADGTIYNYFENKTDLLLSILNRVNETESREADLGQADTMDIRLFCQQYFRHRLSVLTQDGQEIFQVILSEALVNADLRERYFQQIVAPTFAVGEAHFTHLMETGRIRRIDVPLTLRAIAAMVMGMLLLRILGDPQLQNRWDELPDLLTALILDGIDQSQGVSS